MNTRPTVFLMRIFLTYMVCVLGLSMFSVQNAVAIYEVPPTNQEVCDGHIPPNCYTVPLFPKPPEQPSESTSAGTCSCSCSSSTEASCSCSCTFSIPIPLPVIDQGAINAITGVAGAIAKLTADISNSGEAKLQTAGIIHDSVFSYLSAMKTVCDDTMKFFGQDKCRTVVENWGNFLSDIPKNVRLKTINEIQSTDLDLRAMEMLKATLGLGQDSSADQEPFNKFEDMYLKQGTQEGWRITPHTTLGGALVHLTQQNNRNLALITQQYLDQQTDSAVEAGKMEAQSGQGALSSQECLTQYVNRNGQVVGCAKYSANMTESMTNEAIRTGINAEVNAITSATILSSGMQSQISPQQDPDTGLYTGGIALLRGLANAANGDIGMFESGPSAPAPKLVAKCSLSFTPQSKTVLVGKNATTSISIFMQNQAKLKDISLSVSDTNIISLNTTKLEPKEDPGKITQQFSVTISGNKPGTAIVTATASMQETQDICAADIPLRVTVAQACLIAPDKTDFVFPGQSDVQWTNAGMPNEQFTMKQNLKADISGTANAALQINAVAFKVSNPLIANATPDSVSISGSTPVTASTLVTAFKTGTSTLEINVTAPDKQTVLCTKQIPMAVGYRCKATRCPAYGCYPPTCQDSTPETTSPLHSCYTLKNIPRTEYCDYYTGVRLADQNNAWCIDSAPPVFANLCQNAVKQSIFAVQITTLLEKLTSVKAFLHL